MNRGFTLLELIVVIAVMAILAALFVGAGWIAVQMGNAKVSEGRVHILGCKAAEYRNLNGYAPAGLIQLAPAVMQPSWIREYRFVDGWDQPLEYEAAGKTFRLWSIGRDGISGTPDDLPYMGN